MRTKRNRIETKNVVLLNSSKAGIRGWLRNFVKYFKAHPFLYIMLIPGFFFLFIYKFWPLYGLEMAFKNYNIFAGSNPMDSIGASEWVGLYWFKRLFSSSQFPVVLRNTLVINFMKIIFLFPIPIIASILLNEIGSFSKQMNQAANLGDLMGIVHPGITQRKR